MNNQNYSNPLSRILAYLIDSIICGTPLLIAAFSSNKIISIIFLITTIALAIYNYYYLMAKKRATMGMQFMEMRMFKLENDKISENPLSYGYLLLRNIISGILSEITFGIENIIIFFTKKKQTLHDIIFKSVFLNNPPRNKYLIASGAIILVILVGFMLKNYILEERQVLTYKINNVDYLDAYGTLSDNLKVQIPEIDFSFNESKNEISIILPIGFDKKIVQKKISEKTNNLKFKELSNEQWVDSGISNSDIERAELSFDSDSGDVNILLKFNSGGAIALQNFTERNLNKEVKIVINNQEIFSGTVNEKILGGEMIFSKDSISEAKDIIAKINMGNSDSLTLVRNGESQKMLKKIFTWIKK